MAHKKLTSAGPLVKASENTEDSKGLCLTKQEVMANAFILIFAGHETSGGITHHSFLWLAIKLSVQAQLQADIDAIVDSDAWSTWTYENDLGRLSQSMVGAVINETLRLLPPIIDIPKIVRVTSDFDVGWKDSHGTSSHDHPYQRRRCAQEPKILPPQPKYCLKERA